ncbi:MAG: tripartite tricarboxylate transporter substrate binding protein [Desulfobacteraceae bacterium]|nr:MAG: tripartite tricarboxylate transporter substrate binding protein [Desulfobacteraceae bacterium]
MSPVYTCIVAFFWIQSMPAPSLPASKGWAEADGESFGERENSNARGAMMRRLLEHSRALKKSTSQARSGRPGCRVNVFASFLLTMVLPLLLASPQVWSAEKFPDRPINVIINFGAGGATDVVARALAKQAEKELGVSLMIANKPGGGGTVGVTEVARAKPDGYTLGSITMSTVTIVPFQRKVPYDYQNGLDYLLGFGRFEYGIAVKAGSPYKNIDDLVQAARKNPEKVTFATIGYPAALVAGYLEQKENVQFAFVPFPMGPGSAVAVVGGHVDFFVSSPSTMRPFLESKDIRVLAVAAPERWSICPDAPTMKEVGYDIDASSWVGLAAPAGIPPERLEQLRKAFKNAFHDKDFQELAKKMDMVAPYMGGNEFKTFMDQKRREFEPIIKALEKKDPAK